ncbi:NPC intracellular cholesterol transporter 1 [Halotydeus destructor]|nr:NPC intracellular cholesterol transporter 1 [Halotydeus destructor]
MYESCRDVTNIFGSKILGTFCAPHSAEDCTVEHMLAFVGSDASRKGYSPYQANFMLTSEPVVEFENETYIPANEETVKCSEAPTPQDDVCPCSHCRDSCPLPLNSTGTSEVATKASQDSDDEETTTHFAEIRPPLPDSMKGKCLLSGSCGKDTNLVGEVDIPCYEKHDPHHIDDKEAIDILYEICPELVADSDDPLLCCSAQQIYTLHESLYVPLQLGLSKCPSCAHNFRVNFCQSVCSPNQSDFIAVTETNQNSDGRNKTISVDYFINREYTSRTYESCKNVQGPAPGLKALAVLCGQWGDDHCSDERWFNFLGVSIANGGNAPFQINYRFSNESEMLIDEKRFIPMNVKSFKCSEKPDPDSFACSCTDCEETCEVQASPSQNSWFPEAKQANEIIGFSECEFASMILAIIFLATIILYFSIDAIADKNSYSHEFTPALQSPDSISPSKGSGLNSSTIATFESDTIVYNNVNIGLRTEKLFEDSFRQWGVFVASNPIYVLSLSLLASMVLSMGVGYWTVTTDPVDLWVSPSSEARQDMELYNKNFGKFYRLQQVIVAPKDERPFSMSYIDGKNNVSSTFGPAFKQDFLLEVFKLQESIEHLSVQNGIRNVTLNSVCYKPLGNKCATQSIFTFFLDDEKNIRASDYIGRIAICTRSPTSPACTTLDGIPLINPGIALGGFEGKDYIKSKALIISIPVNNHNDATKNEDALLWETKFLDFMQDYALTHPNFTIGYKAERSIEDELDRQSQSDIVTVAVSYLIMFIYIILALGEINNCGTFLLDARFTLGFVGVFVVLLSVVSSLGFFFFLGVPATLIIVEVVPFLVLAVGVDNIFILAQHFQRDDPRPDEQLVDQIGRVVGEVAPSMLLSSLSMSSCFFIGSLTEMPAVNKFALYAGVALVINFFLQMTAFLAIFTLDTQRQLDNRLDIFCCIQEKKSVRETGPKETFLYAFFRDMYAPFLMKKSTRIVVLIVFAGWICSSVYVLDKVHIGLEQDLTFPDDSYMTKYFDHYQKYFQVGPPVYFMITGDYNYSDHEAQNRICGLTGCDTDSLSQMITYFTKQVSERTYLKSEPSVWLDAYIEYLRGDKCCYKNNVTGSQCLPEKGGDHLADCQLCLSKAGNKYRPHSVEFEQFLPFFLNQNPSTDCVRGGRALFMPAISLDGKSDGHHVQSTYIMTYRTVLKSSEDFYESLRSSRIIADLLTAKLQGNGSSKATVRSYSYPDVFYEQYLTMWPDTARSLIISIATVFIVVYLFLGLDVYSAAIIAFTITMIIINLMGMMYWWDISLNAVSLVNLVVGVGISVEFCSHLVRSFVISTEPSRVLRAKECLAKMGSSVLSGITLTDCGILILAFAKSKIFQVIYFRMYLSIIAFGTVHSLVFLPVLLSIVGPPLNKQRVLLNSSATGTTVTFHQSDQDNESAIISYEPTFKN